MIYVWIIGLSLLVTALFSAAEMSFIAANRVAPPAHGRGREPDRDPVPGRLPQS